MAFQELEKLDTYCRKTLERSDRHAGRWGPLHVHALKTMDDASIWNHSWAPLKLDHGKAHLHPVYQDSFSDEQRRAWSHLQWVMDYVTVGQGEQQVVVLNKMAARRFRTVCPSVCELQERESDEEEDHIKSFFTVRDAVARRYFPRNYSLQVEATSGTRSGRVNAGLRWIIGKGADRIFGSNFPTLFFLTRGMKSHTFKPFEIAYTRNEESHPAMRQHSAMHGWDESRHIATAQHMCRLANPLLDEVPQENKLLFRLAMERLWPKGRLLEYRVRFWRMCLEDSVIFSSIPSVEREQLLRHIRTEIESDLLELHPLQKRMVGKSNRRIVEECGLSPELKREFVAFIRSDPNQAAVVSTVRIDA
jgi:hypothetical protein